MSLKHALMTELLMLAGKEKLVKEPRPILLGLAGGVREAVNSELRQKVNNQRSGDIKSFRDEENNSMVMSSQRV